jgi:hypothetical protein
MVRVSTSLIRIDRMAIPVAGSIWDGSKADMSAGKSGAASAALDCAEDQEGA